MPADVAFFWEPDPEDTRKSYNLFCYLFGHKLAIEGLTGQYRWCIRCAKRHRLECH